MKQTLVIQEQSYNSLKQPLDIINKIISYDFDTLNAQQLLFLARIIYDNYDQIQSLECNEHQQLRILMLISKILISEQVPLVIKAQLQQMAYKLSEFDYEPPKNGKKYYSNVFQQIYNSIPGIEYHKVNNEILDVIEPYLPNKILLPRNTKDALILLRYKQYFQNFNVYRLYGFLMILKSIYFNQLNNYLYLFEPTDIEQILIQDSTILENQQLELIREYIFHGMMDIDTAFILQTFEYIKYPQNRLKFLKIISQHQSIYDEKAQNIIFSYKVDKEEDLIFQGYKLVVQLILKNLIETKQYQRFSNVKAQLQHLQQENAIFHDLLLQLEKQQLDFV